MNHKSIIRMFAVLFCFSLFDTILLFKSSSLINPEILFALIFAVMIVACIMFFKKEDSFLKKNKRFEFIEILNQDLIIHTNAKSQKVKRNPLTPFNFTAAHNLKKSK